MVDNEGEMRVRSRALRFRINLGMKQINERQEEVERTPNGEYKKKLWATMASALEKLGELLWEYWAVARRPFHCPAETTCETCTWRKQERCGGL